MAEALAEGAAVDLLSADSQLVYRGMDIGTAKPKPKSIGYWQLLNLVDPGQAFSAGTWAGLAASACRRSWAEGRTPLIAGGSGLYLAALLRGLADIPAVAPEIRRGLLLELQSLGLEALYRRLEAEDPDLARRTDPRNPRRVLRGLEVKAASGRRLSEWQRDAPPAPLGQAEELWLGLDPGAAELDRRIEDRLDHSLASGWLAEVQFLCERWGVDTLRNSAAIGYRELAELSESRMDASAARASILRRTRLYARRQRTWFRREPAVRWCNHGDELMLRAKAYLKGC